MSADGDDRWFREYAEIMKDLSQSRETSLWRKVITSRRARHNKVGERTRARPPPLPLLLHRLTAMCVGSAQNAPLRSDRRMGVIPPSALVARDVLGVVPGSAEECVVDDVAAGCSVVFCLFAGLSASSGASGCLRTRLAGISPFFAASAVP